MAAHITYLSEAGLTEKFGRRLQDREAKSFGFDADFQIESYLQASGHQPSPGGSMPTPISTSPARWTISTSRKSTAAKARGLADAFAGARDVRFCVISFDTDWLYPTAESRAIVHALNAVAAPVSFVELSAPFGHDSFLLDVPALDRVVRGFLA